MRLCLLGVFCAAVLPGCSTAREAPPQPANAQDIPRTTNGKPDFTGVWELSFGAPAPSTKACSLSK